jgi:voltage-gated potassium channel
VTAAAAAPLTGFRATLRALYYGRGDAGRYFQSLLLAVDLAVLAYFIATTFVAAAPWLAWVDLALGLLLTAEFVGRLLAHRHPMRYFDNFAAFVDVAVILSLLTAWLVDNLGFLRVLRTLRLLRSYQVLGRLTGSFAVVREHEEAIGAALNLLVFLIMVSSVVYANQVRVNPEIGNFLDALYFSLSTLTTVGFGDITLVGTSGRLLSVAIMIVGISLFLRLVQAVFRPDKVRFPCPGCGLQRHDLDAVHCKACGLLLAIPNEGE